MAKPLTLNEVVPKAIQILKDLQRAIHTGSLNNYQIDLYLTGVTYLLEHPELHLSDGTVIFK